MKTILTIIGFVLGGVLGDAGEEMLGLFVGAVLGFLLARLIEQQRRIAQLEQRVNLELMAGRTGLDAGSPPEIAVTPDMVVPPATPVESAEPTFTPEAAQARTAKPEQQPEPADWQGYESESVSAASAPTAPREPSRIDVALRAARRWLTTGNIPVKMGVVISFFGVAFLFKYAIDRQMLVLPIEFRLLSVAVAAIGVLILGWRLREKMPAYGLTLQGGGVGVLYLTIFAAFRLYDLIPSGFAFGLLVLLTIGAGVLAVVQNTKSLAMLGIAGGFLAPVLISTGGGSHVGLFSYYLLLNAAILGIAWHRSWRELNFIGFIFTFTIGGLWGYRTYRPELFGSTEPFLILFFVMYQVIAIIFALRQAPRLRGIVDGTLVFGTPVIAFAMQAVMMRDSEYGLAISAVVLALFYAVGATGMMRFRKTTLKVLAESYVALSVVFATLAIPLALDARWTAGAWALEGAALVWVGLRQHSLLSRFAGVALVLAAGVAFGHSGWEAGRGMPLLNGNVLGGLLISVSAFFSSRYMARESVKWITLHRLIAAVLFVWAMGWWLRTGLMEVDERVVRAFRPMAVTLFLSLSAAALLFVSRRFQWRYAALGCFVLLPLLLLPVWLYVFHGHHPAANLGWIAWPAAFAVQMLILRVHENAFPWLAFVSHVLTVLLLALLAIWEAGWQLDHAGLNETWVFSLITAVPGLIVLAMIYAPGWPVAQNWRAYVGVAGGVLVTLSICMAVVVTVGLAGEFDPLPYVPVLNPLDLVAAFTLLVAVAWVVNLRANSDWLSSDAHHGRLRVVRAIIGLAAFIGSTMILLRAIHHYADVRWDTWVMFQSVLVQAALSIYWGSLALVAMIFGARRVQRPIWLLGAALMGVVVVKLFIVELGNTGTVARIVSFIGIGVLLLIIGYFAPAPPRLESGAKSESDSEDESNPVSEPVPESG